MAEATCDLEPLSAVGIVLEAPPAASMVGVVREAVGGCASVAGFAPDEVDDARLVVDEAFIAMVVLGVGPVVVSVEVGPGVLTVVMRAAATSGASWLVDQLQLVRSVIEVLTVDHGFGLIDGFVWVRLELVTDAPRPTG